MLTFLMVVLTLMTVVAIPVEKIGIGRSLMIAFPMMGLVFCGALMLREEGNGVYAAATRQGIAITLPLTGWVDAYTTEPCRVQLEQLGEGNNAKLVLPGTTRVVTPRMLDAICKEG